MDIGIYLLVHRLSDKNKSSPSFIDCIKGALNLDRVQELMNMTSMATSFFTGEYD